MSDGENMIGKNKKLFLFISLFIIIISMISIGPISASESEDMENPYGEDEWKFKDVGLNIDYEHEDDKIDIYSKNFTASGNTLSIQIINETQDSVNVLFQLELENHTKEARNIDYTELVFRIDKNNNDATLVENDHPEEGSRFGFFPFWGFYEDDIYESDTSFNYPLGGHFDSIRKAEKSWISYLDLETMENVKRDVGASYSLRNEGEDKIRKDTLIEDRETTTMNRFLRVNVKQHEGRLYPTGGSIYTPPEFFIENPTDEEMVFFDLDYSYEQKDAMRYLETLPPFEEEGNDEGLIPKEIMLLMIFLVFIAFVGYTAYMKKEEGFA